MPRSWWLIPTCLISWVACGGREAPSTPEAVQIDVSEPGATCSREASGVIREPTDPPDPWYPVWWSSEWTMYRVFQNYDKNPPPYDSPPKTLSPADYEASQGATYYDATYVPADKDGVGAMMEHYKERCLPIFKAKNDFTCWFVSLGNKTWLLRVDKQPEKPECCLFSPEYHPPRRDFIKHLPYNPKDSGQTETLLQAYSMVVENDVLFGYAFEKTRRADSYDTTAEPYQHPHSFYFSGETSDPPAAPIISQNYSNFRMERPSADRWEWVKQMCPPETKPCSPDDDGTTKNKTVRSRAAPPVCGVCHS